MITFFTTAKPFRGHDGIIQRNALKSWKLLHPDVEVILFGDEEGAEEVCAEYGLRHEPHVERHEGKIPYVNFMFRRAQEIARHDYLCYSNCDIILLDDFLRACKKASKWRKLFLLVGQRWDTDINVLIDFNRPYWAQDLRQLALTRGAQQISYFIDFFLFSKGLYENIPPLIVGHCYWDTWMVWKALSERIPVLDASHFIVPVHQNHGYSPESQRSKGSNTDARSRRNHELAGGDKNVRSIEDSTYYINHRGSIHLNLYRYKRLALWELQRILIFKLGLPAWHFVLGLTRPLRSVLGLRSKAVRLREKG